MTGPLSLLDVILLNKNGSTEREYDFTKLIATFYWLVQPVEILIYFEKAETICFP